MHLRSLPALGSSPLARGTLFDEAYNLPNEGLIPARAGNTFEMPWKNSPQKAHPRSRGEHFFCTTASMKAAGSSPLARGTLQLKQTFTCSIGLIPARAGNTNLGSVTVRGGRAHPRSRGEHTC